MGGVNKEKNRLFVGGEKLSGNKSGACQGRKEFGQVLVNTHSSSFTRTAGTNFSSASKQGEKMYRAMLIQRSLNRFHKYSRRLDNNNRRSVSIGEET